MAFLSKWLGLHIWNSLSDPFDSAQLARNFSKLDQHDHAPGRGVQIPTEGVKDGAITNAKLASAITLLPDLGVTSGKLSDNSVTPSKLDTWKLSYIPQTEATSVQTYVDLATVGPSLTITIPENGFVLWYATAIVANDGAGGGIKVALYEDNVLTTQIFNHMPASTVATYPFYTLANSTVGTQIRWLGSTLCFVPQTAGTHTYTLKYSAQGTAATNASFRERKLAMCVVDPN